MHKINKKVSAPVQNKHLQSTMPFKCVFVDVVVVVVIHFSRPWGKLDSQHITSVRQQKLRLPRTIYPTCIAASCRACKHVPEF